MNPILPLLFLLGYWAIILGILESEGLPVHMPRWGYKRIWYMALNLSSIWSLRYLLLTGSELNGLSSVIRQNPKRRSLHMNSSNMYLHSFVENL